MVLSYLSRYCFRPSLQRNAGRQWRVFSAQADTVSFNIAPSLSLKENFSCFVRTPACDRRTFKRTDTCHSIASREKLRKPSKIKINALKIIENHIFYKISRKTTNFTENVTGITKVNQINGQFTVNQGSLFVKFHSEIRKKNLLSL